MPYVKTALGKELRDRMRIVLAANPYKLHPEPSCDFCGERPWFVYAATAMTNGTRNPCWRWAACHECAAAIDTDDWDMVRERMISKLKRKCAAPVSQTALDKSVEPVEPTFKQFAVRRDNRE